MVSIESQSWYGVVEFASFASTEIVMFVMAVVVYMLFAHGKVIPSKQAKFAKAASPPTSGGRGKGKQAGMAQAPWRRQAGPSQARGPPCSPNAELPQPAAEIKALSHEGNLDGAAAVLRRLQEGGAPPSAVLHNCFLDACVQSGDLGRALAQFAEMKQLDIVDIVTYNTMLKAHLRRSQVVEAQDLLREMSASGLKASAVTYHELLNTMVSTGEQRGIWCLVDEMRKAGVPVSSITISILLKSLTERSSPADVQRIMGLLDTLEGPVDVVLFSSVIEASVRVRQLGFLSDLLRRNRASENVVVLSAPLYGSMIKAFGKTGDTAQVHKLWCEMEARGVMPTEITVGCMVEALVVNGQADEALDLVHKLQEDSKHGCMNTVIYSTLMKGFAYKKKVEQVFAVYEEMQKQDVQCNTITYNTMLDACAKSGAMDRAPALLEDMRRVESEPDLITYSTLIKGYCLQGSVDKAFQVFQDLKSNGTVQPDEVMYNSLLDGCAHQQRVEEALSVLAEMQGAGVVPSNYTLSILVKLLGRTRRLSQAFKIVEDLSSRHGFHPNVQVYTCLMQACFMNRKLEQALEVHDTMIAKGCLPDEKLYVSLARGCLQLHAPRRAGDVVRAAFKLPGGTLTVSARGRVAGIEARTLEEVLEALRGGRPDDRAAAAALAADVTKARGVPVGGRNCPSKNGVAPWCRGDR